MSYQTLQCARFIQKILRTIIPGAALLGFLLAAVTACHTASNDPGIAYKEFLMHCNAGEYTQADDLLSANDKAVLHGELGAMAGGLKGICDKNTNNGNINKVDITDVQTRGEGASVRAQILFKDGSTSTDAQNMIKENGGWKLAD